MEAARLTLADGFSVDLSDVHILCTSNLGSEAARGISGRVPAATLRRVVEEEARGFFGSAVMARFTDIVVYRSLDYECQRAICYQKLTSKIRHLERQLKGSIQPDEGVVDYLMRLGWHRDLGARHLRHAVDRELGDAAVRYSLAVARPGTTAFRLRVESARLALEPADSLGA
jgi:ATP-dependent Clp protease ATP-binding subunit ClpC